MYEKESKERLKKIAAKHTRTAFIGALSDFEEVFGYLWGHGEPEGYLTEQQERFAELWEEVRNSILDRGNKEIRSFAKEIDNHKIEWQRYHMDLPVKPLRDDQITNRRNYDE